MVSSAISSAIFKDNQNCTSPKDECTCNLKSLKTHECMFSQISRETVLLRIAAERERGSTLFLTEFTRPSLLLGTMYIRISICFCPDVVIPGEFRNLQVNLKNEGCVRTIFCAARACVLLHQFPCARSRRSGFTCKLLYF